MDFLAVRVNYFGADQSTANRLTHSGLLPLQEHRTVDPQGLDRIAVSSIDRPAERLTTLNLLAIEPADERLHYERREHWGLSNHQYIRPLSHRAVRSFSLAHVRSSSRTNLLACTHRSRPRVRPFMRTTVHTPGRAYMWPCTNRASRACHPYSMPSTNNVTYTPGLAFITSSTHHPMSSIHLTMHT